MCGGASRVLPRLVRRRKWRREGTAARHAESEAEERGGVAHRAFVESQPGKQLEAYLRKGYGSKRFISLENTFM